MSINSRFSQGGRFRYFAIGTVMCLGPWAAAASENVFKLNSVGQNGTHTIMCTIQVGSGTGEIRACVFGENTFSTYTTAEIDEKFKRLDEANAIIKEQQQTISRLTKNLKAVADGVDALTARMNSLGANSAP